MGRRLAPWLRLGMETWMLGAEAASVISLRTLKIAAGGAAAQSEAALMISEKIDAAQALTLMALTGRLGASPDGAASKAISHYRRKVRANRRRLQRTLRQRP